MKKGRDDGCPPRVPAVQFVVSRILIYLLRCGLEPRRDKRFQKSAPWNKEEIGRNGVRTAPAYWRLKDDPDRVVRILEPSRRRNVSVKLRRDEE